MIAVIGSGPAGISAATYIKRANMPVMILTNHKSSLLKAKAIENYYGVGKISGENLYHQGLTNALALDIPIVEDEIVNISIDPMVVEGLEDTYHCDAIILATGSSEVKSNIPGVAEFEGKGVSYCATCDGYFFKNKKIVVIGNGEYAKHEYEYLKNISSDITLVSADTIKTIAGNDSVEKLILNGGTEMLADGIFIAENYPDSSILAKKIGLLERNGRIGADEQMKTNIPGIFVCGDITVGPKQIAKAVYEGMIAANNAILFYKENKKD